MNITAQQKPTCPFESGALKLSPDFLVTQYCDELFTELLNEDHWNRGSYLISGRRFLMPRFQTWYADPGIRYNFSYDLHRQRDWTPALYQLKQAAESRCNDKFNSVLINWYRDGYDWVDWHSDNERELGGHPVIASVSLGATRQFLYRDKYLPCSQSVELRSNSLLIMNPDFQKYWQHSIPLQREIIEPRINLTFRHVVMPS